jgi:hypothetical protein
MFQNPFIKGGSVALLLLIAFACTGIRYTKIRPQQAAMKIYQYERDENGNVKIDDIAGGTIWYNAWIHDLEIIPLTIQSEEVTFDFPTKGGQTLTITLTEEYEVVRDQAADFYRSRSVTPDQMFRDYITPTLQNSAFQAGSHFTPNEILRHTRKLFD